MYLVDVPNILLQDDWRINVYAYDANYTKHSERFDVITRTRPENYVYTEAEQMKWEQLEERINEIEENGFSEEVIDKAVNNYLTENPIEVDLTGYATETYVNEAVAAIPQPDLSEYALKTEIPSTSGLATEKYVDEKFNSIEIPDVDLSNYYTKSEVDNLIPDTTGYALKSEIPDVSGFTTMNAVEEKGYQTEAQVNTLINTALGVVENGSY